MIIRVRESLPAGAGYRYLNKGGQTFLEYAAIVAITAGVLMIMTVYLNRSLQGRLRATVESLGGEHSLGSSTPTAGPAFGSSTSDVDKDSWSFTHEGKKGRVQTVGGSSRSEETTITGAGPLN